MHIHKISFFAMVILVVSSTLTSEGAKEWSTAADMQIPRTEITASAIGSRIYVVGGFSATGATVSTVEVYDPRSNTWSDGKELPIALHHTAAVSYQGKLYIVGGFSEGWIPSNTLFIYDLLTNEWVRGKDMPTPRGALTAQFVNGMLYAAGGWNGSPLAVNEAYDPSTNSWTTKASMPTPREHLSSGVVDGKLYVIGGRQGNLLTNLNVNEEYNPASNEWTAKVPMPSKRGGLVAVSLSDSIYVFGGEATAGTFYNNEQYIPSLDMWITRERMPTARHGLAAAEAGGSIYVIGGGPVPGLSVSAKNEVFTPTDWKKAISVNVSPEISIQPNHPKIDDKIQVTVSFETNTTEYLVKFDEPVRVGKTFTADVTVVPPSSDAIVAQVVTKHSHTYTMEELAVGDYMFHVSINEQKPATARFTVTANALFIDVMKDGVKETMIDTPVVLQRGIKNPADKDQGFLSILQVKDENGIVVSLTWLSGKLAANESRQLSQTWTPDTVGKYTLQFFVWESMENPRILDSMYAIGINVS